VVRLKSQRRRRQDAQQAIDTKTCSFRNSLARCVQQAKHDPEAIFELRWVMGRSTGSCAGLISRLTQPAPLPLQDRLRKKIRHHETGGTATHCQSRQLISPTQMKCLSAIAPALGASWGALGFALGTAPCSFPVFRDPSFPDVNLLTVLLETIADLAKVKL
jgi:hypothetical protein